MDGKRASEIRKEYARVFESLPQLADKSDKDGQALVIDAAECFDALADALNACAPEGLSFGSHPGDGSDFGFWPVESDGSSAEEPAKTCSKCGGRVLSKAEHVQLNQVMDADHKFAGEWSGSFDYYKDICRCDEEEGE